MIAVVNYGVGNVFSLISSLNFIGTECILSDNFDEITNADHIILPGVGAFGDAIAKLRETGLDKAVLESAENNKPLLGICLGMQLLFEQSEEYGVHKGLGLIEGNIKGLAPVIDKNSKIPNIGWHNLKIVGDCAILKNTKNTDSVYYVHSFYAPRGDKTRAFSEYGNVEISGVVQNKNVFGTQFHPEKSGEAGLNILRAFADL